MSASNWRRARTVSNSPRPRCSSRGSDCRSGASLDRPNERGFRQRSLASPHPASPRRWLRRLAIAVVSLVALLAVSYSVLTSRAFFKGVILPKAGQALHARVTVADAVIRPFSMVTLRDLKVETTGTEPLLTAREVR